MITKLATKKQLAAWKRVWLEKAGGMRPNRIGGEALNAYFLQNYAARPFENAAFREAVSENAAEAYGEKAGTPSEILCYVTDGDVYVGIDPRSGAFHVESEDVEKCVPIWNDLFVRRGLDENDLKNFVLVGQYAELSEEDGK